MQKRMGQISGIDLMNGVGVISPIDDTDDLVVPIGELLASVGERLRVGTLVSFRERFHRRHRVAWSIEASPENVIAFRRAS